MVTRAMKSMSSQKTKVDDSCQVIAGTGNGEGMRSMSFQDAVETNRKLERKPDDNGTQDGRHLHADLSKTNKERVQSKQHLSRCSGAIHSDGVLYGYISIFHQVPPWCLKSVLQHFLHLELALEVTSLSRNHPLNFDKAMR